MLSLFVQRLCVNFIVFWERAGGAGWARKVVVGFGKF